MSSSIDLLEKIDRFTRGEMGLEEREAFEKEMNLDENLRNKVEISQFVDQMVVANEALKLKEQMRKDLYKPASNWKRNLGILVVFGVLSGGGFLVYQHVNEKPTPTSHAISDVPLTETKEKNISPVYIKKDSVFVKTTEKIAPLNTSPKNILITENQATKTFVSDSLITVEKQIISVVPSSKPGTKNEETKTENAAPTKIINPCAELQNKVEFTVVASCKSESTGEIHLYPESIKGGKPPYTFYLGDQKATFHFDGLAAGKYKLTLKDAQNCVVEVDQVILVTEKECRTTQQFMFNPDYDQAWAIPYSRSKEPIEIEILEKGGRVFFTSPVSKFSPSEWTGSSSTGLKLDVGVYFFKIKYSDGSVETGTVTISK